ncbi:N-acetylmuramoyl-L-alanine amidase [Heyndrickxia coagulans]|uniref:N-acetylmuramoyl-L-alanine amidase n=1 Tax=Heyndrickxia coagulans TaxID=1398 RepID=UPI0028126679|nr:N-acetylmuramoyl-L-alanine amidase [Heyndrickxia coagulans]WMM90622.1 N-acetylmuramoyl-L-alanine amidase [Heyndrickxia coagulans]
MKKLFFRLFFLVLFFLIAPGVIHAGAEEAGTVTHAAVYIRSGPGVSYPIAGKAAKNDTYTVLQKDGDWFQIRLPSGNTGWIAGWLVETGTPSAKQSKQGKITADRLRIRKAPDQSAAIVGTLEKNAAVTVTRAEGGWVYIESGNVSGWADSQYVQTEKNRDAGKTAENNVSAAIVAATSLNIRRSPSLQSGTVATVTYGTRLEITGTDHGWYEVELEDGTHGWVAGFYVTRESQAKRSSEAEVTLHSGTNLYKRPQSGSDTVGTAKAGDRFPIVSEMDGWYKIRLESGTSAYISAKAAQKSDTAVKKGIKGKTIVLDPGHGGTDNGTTGAYGTLEKLVTLKTANALYEKLKKAGARVILTRNSDTYVSLSERTAISNTNHVDAFVSIHFDSAEDPHTRGHTTYYYHAQDYDFARLVNNQITSRLGTVDRGVKFGDFHVIRENTQPAILLELGYLSSPAEEKHIVEKSFQTKAVAGIYNGLKAYFQ